jgi:hypothetical protein
MAEAALYGNHKDHSFPFAEAVDALRWVVPYVDSLTSKRMRNTMHAEIFSTFIQILLVFGRARTSTLLIDEWLEVSKDFIGRLNRSLGLLPKMAGASFHKLSVVHRRAATFFVVCDSSPRFNWSRTLTHQHVGQNLDFCGAGQIYGEGVQKRFTVTVFTFDGAGQYKIVNEGVFLDEVSDTSPINTFFDKRTALFNHTMSQLRLP